MLDLNIRRITVGNLSQFIPGIVHTFRDDPVVPWYKHDECMEWITRRVNRDFYIAVACMGDRVVGYNEWIETYDDGKKILYLGIMQTDCDLRSRGIGRAMLDDGALFAKSINATHLRTIPEEERSHNFYRKNGFVDTDTLHLIICPTVEAPDFLYTETTKPFTIETINAHTFIFGLAQSSGRHMYECANHHPESTGYTAKTICLPDGYLQFRYKKEDTTAEALYWSNTSPQAQTVDRILAHAYDHGFDNVQFYMRSKHRQLFDGRPTIIKEGWSYEFIELERKIDHEHAL